jgi:hypothetical protein
MKINKLKRKSTEALESELRGVKIITGTLAITLTVLFAVNLYGLLLKDNNTAFIAGMAVAISLSAILPSQFSSMIKIKKELKLRENSNLDS